MVSLTTTQVAARLGINSSRVRQLAIERRIGTKINSRTRIFTEEEAAMIDALRQPVGRPKFSTMISDPEISPEPTMEESVTHFAALGVVTDPMFGEEQVVTMSRGSYDRFIAALDAAPVDHPLAIAGRALVEHADADDASVDFPLPAFARFAGDA